MAVSKPFVKWVGGKTQLLPTIFEKFPKEINNYHEPFIGGGSVLFHLLDKVNEKSITVKGSIYVYDYNINLINVYKDIQSNPENLFNEIMKHKDKLSSLEGKGKEALGKGRKKDYPKTVKASESSRESYYYWQRDMFNKMKPCLEKSALFIFLNKTCFRGVYREGPNGFNVPYGGHSSKEKIPEIITLKYLKDASVLLKKVIFKSCDYKESFKNIKSGDFVYLDPPYVPEDSKSFVAYNKGGFSEENHKELFKLCHGLKDKKISFMMSNSKVDTVTESFVDAAYVVSRIVVKRSINSKNPGSKTEEVIITNY